ncbi:VOC family protein [Sandaracinobacteroides saxicola]|uniref:VOC family protein n=1 Tax=Sandaracinobacteroides saxicola TaxID=2759707 RepID=A0A7G5ILU6_9SPHN|nr:VOC family protein [Sandaracinobacteroides saxicola]QMW24338.1 VOC family protein [Sandaracinobacteroides saxicola]
MGDNLKGIHHSAYRCRDAEETRAFYEDRLGLPLAAVVQEDHEPGTGTYNPFVHLFFRMADGNFIAFFDAPKSAGEFKPVHGFDRHVAFEAEDEATLLAWRDRLNAEGVPCFGPIDHGFVQSVYFYDPNGLPLEITTRVAAHDAILEEDARKARAMINAWTARKAREALGIAA